MKIMEAVTGLGALAQEHRLEVFRLLVQVGPGGIPAGKIGERLEIPLSTLSFHLKELKQAGLILCRREGTTLFYSADYESMNHLMTYLTENCCQGQENCTTAGECG